MKLALLAILPFVFASLALAQPESQWSRGYGGGGTEICNAVLPTEDGGFLLAGSSNTYGQGNNDFWIVRTDADGDTLWTRTFGNFNAAICNGAILTDDGGFLFLGQLSTWAHPLDDYWIIKTDANGDSLWSRAFGGTNGEACVSAKQTPDGGYILAGSTNSFGAGSGDFWLIKTNANGDSLWSRTLGTDLNEWCSSVLLTSDGGYLLAGTGSEWSDVFDNDFVLYKTDSDGNLDWSRIYRGEDQEFCSSMLPAVDGGYVLAGYTHETGDAGVNMMLLKVAENGDSLWSRSLGGNSDDYCHSLETITNRYVLAGYTNPPSAGDDDFMLLATDLDGDSVWSTTFGSPSFDEECNSVRETLDGGFILGGIIGDFGTNIWTVRTYPVQAVLLTSPNGSENWPLFSTQTVTWETDDLPGLMRIEMNRSYPNGSWEILADNTPNDSLEQFYVTGAASNNSRIRISLIGDVYSDVSDTNFIITASSGILQMISPALPNTPVNFWYAGVIEALDTMAESFLLKNFGSEDITVFPPLEPGSAEFSIFSSCDTLVIEPNGVSECSITLRYHPLEIGQHLDTLLLRTDARNGNAQNFVRIPLEGELVVSADESPLTPEEFALHSAYPNPFNSSTTLLFDLPSPSSLTLTVFDITGREVVKTDLGTLPAGTHSHFINAASLPSGLYFARLSSSTLSPFLLLPPFTGEGWDGGKKGPGIGVIKLALIR